MKLLIMLAAIYALIINQSLKQKERKNTTVRVNSPGKIQNIRSDNNIYFNAVFRPNLISMPVQNQNINGISKDLPASLYKQHAFRTASTFETVTPKEILYPVNFYYTPVTKREGLR